MKNEKSRAVLGDFLIMLSIVAVTSVGVFFIRRLFGYGDRSSGTLVYVLRINEIDEELSENVAVGDVLISADTKKELGEVILAEVNDAYRESFSEELGAMISSPVPRKKEIVLTVKSAYKSDTGVTVGGIKLASGKKIGARCAGLFFIGEVGRIML